MTMKRMQHLRVEASGAKEEIEKEEQSREQKTRRTKRRVTKFARLKSLDLAPDPDLTGRKSATKDHEFNRRRRNSGTSGVRGHKSLDLTQRPGSTLGEILRCQQESLIQGERELGEHKKPKCSNRRISR